jgi:hypothetical protein
MGGIVKSFAELIEKYLGIPYDLTVFVIPFIVLCFLIWVYFIKK